MSSKVSIIYTLIARGSKIVLADFTEYSGNFQQISLIMLGKIKKNSKCEIQYNEYKFYYEDENDVTYLCMGENLDTDVAFSYLSDLKRAFLTTYDIKEVLKSYPLFQDQTIKPILVCIFSLISVEQHVYTFFSLHYFYKYQALPLDNLSPMILLLVSFLLNQTVPQDTNTIHLKQSLHFHLSHDSE